jgi:hypothetical protein
MKVPISLDQIKVWHQSIILMILHNFNFWTKHVGCVPDYIMLVILDTWPVRFNYELNFALHSFYGFMSVSTCLKIHSALFLYKISLTLPRHWWSLFWNNISSPIFDDIWSPKATEGNTELRPKSFWLQTPQTLTRCKLHAICLRSLPSMKARSFALCVRWK